MPRRRESAYCCRHKFSYLDDESCDYCFEELMTRKRKAIAETTSGIIEPLLPKEEKS